MLIQALVRSKEGEDPRAPTLCDVVSHSDSEFIEEASCLSLSHPAHREIHTEIHNWMLILKAEPIPAVTKTQIFQSGRAVSTRIASRQVSWSLSKILDRNYRINYAFLYVSACEIFRIFACTGAGCHCACLHYYRPDESMLYYCTLVVCMLELT